MKARGRGDKRIEERIRGEKTRESSYILSTRRRENTEGQGKRETKALNYVNTCSNIKHGYI